MRKLDVEDARIIDELIARRAGSLRGSTLTAEKLMRWYDIRDRDRAALILQMLYEDGVIELADMSNPNLFPDFRSDLFIFASSDSD